MKLNRFGKAAALEKDQLDLIISCLPDNHHRVIAQICRNTACRISEATNLTWECIGNSEILFPKTIVKGKLHSREIEINDSLSQVLNKWRIKWRKRKLRNENPDDFLFYGRGDKGYRKPISTQAFDLALKAATLKANIQGFSSHGFRRSSLTAASNNNVPLAHIRAVSGHQSLQVLQEYLEVNKQQKRAVVAAFA